MPIPLRDYQQTMLDEIRSNMYARVQSQAAVSVTGSGKTVLAASMLGAAAEKGLPSLFLCHRREILGQTSRTFDFAGIPHGVISAGFPEDRRHLTQIASIQTLSRRLNRIREPKFIICDEAHHLGAKSWEALIAKFPKAWLVGLTATPERLDGKGLGKYFQKMVMGPSMAWLIENGFLAPYKLYAPSRPDLAKIKRRAGDFAAEELAQAMDKPTITGDMISHYQRLCPGKRAVLRAVSIAHSKHVAAQFCAAGIVAVHVDGDTPTDERDQAMRHFVAGHIKVLCNVDLFSEGVDVPGIEAVIDGRPTQSLTLWLQFCGRALRPVEGKVALILDHAGNVERHGLPDEDREWSLDGREARLAGKSTQKIHVKLCPGCFAAQKPGVAACRFCGAAFAVAGREVEYAEGDLQQVDPLEFRRTKIAEFKRRLSAGMNPVDAALDIAKAVGGRVADLEYLLKTAQRSRKKPAWAVHVFLARLEKKKAPKPKTQGLF